MIKKNAKLISWSHFLRSIKNNIKPSNFAVVKAVKDNEIHDCLRKTPFCDIAVFDQKTAAGIHMCNTKLDKSSSMQCFECSRLIKKNFGENKN